MSGGSPAPMAKIDVVIDGGPTNPRSVSSRLMWMTLASHGPSAPGRCVGQGRAGLRAVGSGSCTRSAPGAPARSPSACRRPRDAGKPLDLALPASLAGLPELFIEALGRAPRTINSAHPWL